MASMITIDVLMRLLERRSIQRALVEISSVILGVDEAIANAEGGQREARRLAAQGPSAVVLLDFRHSASRNLTAILGTQGG